MKQLPLIYFLPKSYSSLVKIEAIVLICFRYLSFVVTYFCFLAVFLFCFCYYVTISDYCLNALAESWGAET